METVLYTAELVEEDGVYRLVVTDRQNGVVHTTPLSKRAVDKLPYFLTLLNSRQFSAFR